MNKRSIGTDKENLISEFLKREKIEILDRNFLTKHGEIDLVGTDGQYIIFFEVKYRKNSNHGNPLEAINYNKIKKIIYASRVYLYMKHYPETTLVRYDCIGILDTEITWIKNAFSL